MVRRLPPRAPEVCPDCGLPIHRRPHPLLGGNGQPWLVGPYGLAAPAGPMLKRAAAAIKRERLMGGTANRERPKGKKGAKLAEGICPRCEAKFYAPPKYQPILCHCGWLLKVEPLMGGLSADDVVRVFDPTGASGPRNPKAEKERLDEGTARIIRNWLKRGIGRIEQGKDDSGRRWLRLILPTGTAAAGEAASG